jgi:aminoglycoside 3-N-acetyltransferase I
MKQGIKEFQIKRLGQNDIEMTRQLFLLFEKVFEMKDFTSVNELYLTKLLQKPDFIIYVIVHNNEIIGGLTAYELPMYYSEQSEIFIYDIAIQTEFQRMGLGKKLLSIIKEYGRQNGIKEIFVAANEEDKYALDFYRSTGGKAEKVFHFTYSTNH